MATAEVFTAQKTQELVDTVLPDTTSIPDGSRLHTSDSLGVSWIREYLNVRDKGARPLGEVSDFVSSSHFNAAVQDAKNAGGGDVLIPPGEWWAHFSLDNNVKLRCMGGSVLRPIPGLNTPVLTIPGTGTFAYRMEAHGLYISLPNWDDEPVNTGMGVYQAPRGNWAQGYDSTLPVFSLFHSDIRQTGGHGWYVGAGNFTTRGSHVNINKVRGRGLDINATDGWYDNISVGGTYGDRGISINNLDNRFTNSQVWWSNKPEEDGIGWYIGAIHQHLAGCTSEDNAYGLYVIGSLISADFTSHGDLHPVTMAEFNNGGIGRGGYSKLHVTVGQNDRYKPLYGVRFLRGYRGDITINAEWDVFDGAPPIFNSPNLDPDFKYFVDESVDYPNQAQFYGNELHVIGERAIQPSISASSGPLTPDLRFGHILPVSMNDDLTINAPTHYNRVPKGGVIEFHFTGNVNPGPVAVTWASGAGWWGAPVVSLTYLQKRRVVFQNWGTFGTPYWTCIENTVVT